MVSHEVEHEFAAFEQDPEIEPNSKFEESADEFANPEPLAPI